MADLVIKQHDTYPYLRGLAKDQEGIMDLLAAEVKSLKVILKPATGGGEVVEGLAEALDPETDPEGMNWQYKWVTGDTAEANTYNVELEITRDKGADGDRIQTVPNGKYATVEIKADLA